MPSSLPVLSYRVAMPCPQDHLFEVTARVQNWSEATLDLKMPVWTPGSYLVREYARHIQSLRAIDRDGQSLRVQKIAKNHWRVLDAADWVEVHYQLFANELTVRTNHLDASHGYFNPAALCFFIPGYEQQPIELAIDAPPGWQVTTPLPGDGRIFMARDFDELVDSPFEIGTHQVYEFQAGQLPHQLAVYGSGNLDVAKAISDIQKIVPVAGAIFGGLPYDRYLFLLHLTAASYGGLEHKNCCSLIYPRWQLGKAEQYRRFVQLVAHEFFHLWNVKRIFPQGLEKFDYSNENYTCGLWFSEGVTSYYDLLIPQRAGIYDRKTYLAELSKEVTRYLTTPGRLVQPLMESSFDAWIKLYRSDANSSNSQMSYYLKGAMVTWLLDLKIRALSDSQRSFDDVLRRLWQTCGQAGRGFTDAEVEQVIAEIAGIELGDFYRDYLYGLEELPFNEYLQPFGLGLMAADQEPVPFWGLTVKSEGGKEMIKAVAAGSPGAIVGIDPGDELLAIDGFRVMAEKIGERLANYQVGAEIQVTVFQSDRLVTYGVKLAAPQPSKYELKQLPEVTPRQLHNLQTWAGN
jgi:predicted metalloprotease with PDZ domain